MNVVKYSSGNATEVRDSYSRLVVVNDLIFSSLTGGRNLRTKELSPDVAEQTRQVLNTLRESLAGVGADYSDVVHANIIVPAREDVATVMAIVAEAHKGIDPSITVSCAPLAMETVKVEIAITAHRGVGKAEQSRITAKL